MAAYNFDRRNPVTSARTLLPRNFDRFPGTCELSWDASRRLWLVLVTCQGGSGVAECERLSLALELALMAASSADWS